MELPPISGQITKFQTVPNTNLLSPTTRSPIRSPSASPRYNEIEVPMPASIFGTARKPTLKGSKLMGGGYVNMASTSLLSPVVKAARNEVQQMTAPTARSTFHQRQNSVSVAPELNKGLMFHDASNQDFTSLDAGSPAKPQRFHSAVRGGKNSDANIASRVTLQDMMNSVQNVPLFGVHGYKAPTNEHMFKKPRGGMKGFGVKKHSYIVEHTKKKALVPGPGAHHKQENFAETLPKRAGKFSTKDRHTIAGEIMRKKVTPGPSSYQETRAQVDRWKTATSKVGQIPGNYKQLDQNISFVQEYVNGHQEIPAAYNSVDLDKVRNRVPNHGINKDLPRFKKLEKDDKPGSCSYNVEEAFKSQKVPNKEKSFPSWVNGSGTFKEKVSVFYEKAQRSISPGVADKKMNYESYKKLSRSPSLAKARH